MLTFRKVTLQYFIFRKVAYFKKKQVWIPLETWIYMDYSWKHAVFSL